MARFAAWRLLKPLRPEACEIKRLYVDPAARGEGLGRRLLAALIGEARDIGYREAFLDSAPYMAAAHRLYGEFGFAETKTYPGGENDDPQLTRHLIFMRRAL
jgi:GNAT superfamily N-acetyltransferase